MFCGNCKMGRIPSLRNFNAFPHAEAHLLKKTYSGAIVTIFGLIIMVTLFKHELSFYLTTYTVHQMSVDLKREETLPIYINMSFPSLPCEGQLLIKCTRYQFDIRFHLDMHLHKEFHVFHISFTGSSCYLVLSVDAIDMSGKHEVDLHTNIWKIRLDKYGHIIDTEYLSDLVEKEHGAHNHDHGHEHHDEQKHEHTFSEDADKMVKSVKQALENGEGCQVYGLIDVQRVAGNFHISVHGLNIFVADKIFEGSNHVNVSHVIHDLSFGPKYPGIHNPLDDTTRILHDTSGTSKYYIKIVPTEYRYLSKQVLPTNQFSVTEYFVPIRPNDRSWPAVYFLYDLSPITVTIKEERRNFLHFMTRLCAVLGGTFAMTGMLDRWMYRLIESIINTKTTSVLW